MTSRGGASVTGHRPRCFSRICRKAVDPLPLQRGHDALGVASPISESKHVHKINTISQLFVSRTETASQIRICEAGGQFLKRMPHTRVLTRLDLQPAQVGALEPLNGGHSVVKHEVALRGLNYKDSMPFTGRGTRHSDAKRPW